MSRLDDLVRRTPVPYRRLGWVVFLLLTGLIVWAYYAELEEVAIAHGEVAPRGQVKVIQHLEGGIIKKIHVTEGNTVAAGDPLIQLDLTVSGASREELSLRLDSLSLTGARLMAAAHGGEPDFPAQVATRRPNLLANEIKVFDAQRAEFEGVLKILEEQSHQRRLAVAELGAERASVTNSLTISREVYAMSGDLLADGLTPKIEHLKLQAEVEELEGRMAMIEAAIPRMTWSCFIMARTCEIVSPARRSSAMMSVRIARSSSTSSGSWSRNRVAACALLRMAVSGWFNSWARAAWSSPKADTRVA